MNTNAIRVILPYRFGDTWVFDDPGVGLIREPFVAGIPTMIDDLVRDIPNADQGFRLTFSDVPFPGYQREVRWVREEAGGNWYQTVDEAVLQGWLCPALFRYFSQAPKRLFVRADAIRE